MKVNFFLFDEFSPGGMQYRLIAPWVHRYTNSMLLNFTLVRRNKRVLAVPKQNALIMGTVIEAEHFAGMEEIRTVLDQAMEVDHGCIRQQVSKPGELDVFVYVWNPVALPGDLELGTNNFMNFRGGV